MKIVNMATILAIFLAFSPIQSSANNDDTLDVPKEANLKIERMLPTKDAIFLGFTPSPKGCESSYNGFHAAIHNTDPSFNEAFLLLKEARKNKNSLTIEYKTNDACSKDAGKQSLLKITSFTLEEGNNNE